MQIPMFEISWDESDIDAMSAVVRSGRYWTTGKTTECFESVISRYIGVDYGIACNSGTSALHAIMYSLGIGPGDEVIVPSFSFIATANAPRYVGARPVFVDIEPYKFGIDPYEMLLMISNKTKAVIVNHFGGIPCEIEAIREICDDFNIFLVEDAAGALGSCVNNGYVGSFGDASIFSFCQNKVITTGEGGMICTNNEIISKKCKMFISHGRECITNYFDDMPWCKYINIGHNYRMSDITAALGLSQFKKLDYNIKKRREIASRYITHIDKDCARCISSMDYSNYQLFSLLCNNRDDLIHKLNLNGISSRIYFEQIHKFDTFGSDIQLPVTDWVSSNVLSIPIFPTLSNDEQQYIIDVINN